MTNEKLERFGTRIRNQRLAKNMTQLEVAERAGVDVTTYSRLERQGNMTLFKLLNVLMALGIEDEFDTWVKEPPKRFESIEQALRTKTKPRLRVKKKNRRL
jgi:transcriptional regulator with XRE-family HTH domain